MDVKDKVAIITGGASGLGRATTNLLLEKGAKVVMFDINEELANKVADELGDNCIAAIVNVTDEASVEAGIALAKETFGAIHICVNCAGTGMAMRTVGRNGPFPLDAFKFVVDLNLIGTFNVLRLAANEMQNNEPVTEDGERGVIVNTASVAGLDGQIGQAAYSASKAGVIGMTLPIARDLGKLGIRVNTICPGVFNTEMMAKATDEMRDGLSAHAQFPGRLGNPPEFAALAVHLMENSYINGETLRIDASMRMPPK